MATWRRVLATAAVAFGLVAPVLAAVGLISPGLQPRLPSPAAVTPASSQPPADNVLEYYGPVFAQTLPAIRLSVAFPHGELPQGRLLVYLSRPNFSTVPAVKAVSFDYLSAPASPACSGDGRTVFAVGRAEGAEPNPNGLIFITSDEIDSRSARAVNYVVTGCATAEAFDGTVNGVSVHLARYVPSKP